MMDHVIAENRGTLSRDAQRKKTLLSLYYQEKQKEAQRALAPKPAHPSQCHALQDARRFLNEAVVLVDRFIKQLTDESLLSRMQQQRPHKRRNVDDDDDDTATDAVSVGPSDTDVAAVRVINDKLHGALLEKDAWERRVAELDAHAKRQNVAELSQTLAAITRRRRKGYYGAARFLPEARQRQAQLDKLKGQQQRRQRAEGDDAEEASADDANVDGNELDEDDLDALLFEDDNDDDEDGVGSNADDDDDDEQTNAANADDDEIGAFLREHVFQSSAQSQQQQPKKRAGKKASSAAAESSASSLFAGVDFSGVFQTQVLAARVGAVSSASSSTASSLKDQLLELERKAAVNTATAPSPLLAPGGAWDLGAIPSEQEFQRRALEERKAQVRARLLAQQQQQQQ